ncbi:ATP-binding protein [Kitasatospora purpeofusca]|uniref:ATP-binding protein n=1 Tax=Kitasatospora purpeofusca TaxID=67352 RepID=UPI00224EA8ED|nr:ATP-binding protein [Kitasatospora purpeofusca]MCX4755139.1 ATP-binding protein [Kitasatospora purpeofusca]WSR36970.1 ATP-binding protein [Kitasatospora purpeofusca]WSR40217.1 ATP-binding protein [Kitasatospora purpeofusca]
MSGRWQLFGRRHRNVPLVRRPAPARGRVHTVTLANTPAAIALSARTARTVFTSWGVPGRASTLDAVVLVVTELTVNAVRHARSSHLALTFAMTDDHLDISVHDEDPYLPALARPRPGPRAGYGLAVIAEIAGDFGGHLSAGHDPGGNGKFVRVLLPCPRP